MLGFVYIAETRQLVKILQGTQELIEAECAGLDDEFGLTYTPAIGADDGLWTSAETTMETETLR